MKRILSFVLALIMLLALTAAPAFASSYENAYNHVVRIYADYRVEFYYSDGSYIGSNDAVVTGTGFAVGKANQPVQYFVTNAHVVAEELTQESFTVNGSTVHGYVKYVPVQFYIVFKDLDTKMNAFVECVSDRCDLAVLSISEPTTLRTAAVIYDGSSADMQHKDVYAAGFPAISDYNNRTTTYLTSLPSYKTDMTLTSGKIHTVKSHAYTGEGEQYQHDAKISSGNSGGPLLNSKGEVVGVNYAHWVDDPDYALAITSAELMRFLDANAISYITSANDLLVYLLIAAAVLAVAAVAFLVLNKKKPAAPQKITNVRITPPLGTEVSQTPVTPAAQRVLIGMEGASAGMVCELNGSVTIGTNPSRAKFVLPVGTPGVSGLHCTVTFDGVVVKVTDENSSYGTWIDSVRLTPNTPTVMHRGQTLYLGSKKQTMRLGSPMH